MILRFTKPQLHSSVITENWRRRRRRREDKRSNDTKAIPLKHDYR
jgi:hypothetical protein